MSLSFKNCKGLNDNNIYLVTFLSLSVGNEGSSVSQLRGNSKVSSSSLYSTQTTLHPPSKREGITPGCTIRSPGGTGGCHWPSGATLTPAGEVASRKKWDTLLILLLANVSTDIFLYEDINIVLFERICTNNEWRKRHISLKHISYVHVFRYVQYCSLLGIIRSCIVSSVVPFLMWLILRPVIWCCIVGW